MSNPLLEKYEQLYGKKKEPKEPVVEVKKPKALTIYDQDSVNDIYFQIGEYIKDGTAKVISFTTHNDVVAGFPTGKSSVTIEVDVYGFFT